MKNQQYFTSLDEAMKFIRILNENSQSSSDFYNDIHMYPEDNAFIIEWCQTSYSYADEGFTYIDENHEVMYLFYFPDNHAEYFYNEEEAQDALNTWLEEHPTYHKNDFGRWVDESEYAKLKQFIETENSQGEEIK